MRLLPSERFFSPHPTCGSEAQRRRAPPTSKSRGRDAPPSQTTSPRHTRRRRRATRAAPPGASRPPGALSIWGLWQLPRGRRAGVLLVAVVVLGVMAILAFRALRRWGLLQRSGCHNPQSRNVPRRTRSWRPAATATTPKLATRGSWKLPQPQSPQRAGAPDCHNPHPRNAPGGRELPQPRKPQRARRARGARGGLVRTRAKSDSRLPSWPPGIRARVHTNRAGAGAAGPARRGWRRDGVDRYRERKRGRTRRSDP